MEAFVLDVSACMPWCCEDEATAASEELLPRAVRRDALHVPFVGPWELMMQSESVFGGKGLKPNAPCNVSNNLPPLKFHIAPGPVLAEFAIVYFGVTPFDRL